MSASTDPLAYLPPELVLRVLDFVSLRTLACLSQSSLAWHHFIDTVHSDAIYSSKAESDVGKQLFTTYLDAAVSAKDRCMRQARLRHVWDAPRPRMLEERLITQPDDPTNTWRFRPDFDRRLILSTSEFGGLRVNDMDTKELLWSRSDESVGPYTHLEYSQGWACFNRLLGDTIEVWRVSETSRGRFEPVTVFEHSVRTRGFHCRFPHLCVVSDQGKGFVYDLAAQPPRKMTEMFIQEDAYGHVDQNDDVVMWSMGTKGYHVHSKRTGQLLGTLNPVQASRHFHIQHPPKPSDQHRMELLHHQTHYPDRCLGEQCVARTSIQPGRHPSPMVFLAPHEDDEWGAGMFLGDAMIGISSHGRVFITSDWRQAMTSYGWTNVHSVIVECRSGSTDFHRGGWLAVRNGRALVEVYDRIYVIPLPGDTRAPDLAGAPVHAILSSMIPPPNLPISWMGLFDDCLMFTQIMPARWTVEFDRHLRPVTRPREYTKAIKILSFAPAPADDEWEDVEDEGDAGVAPS